MKTKEKTGAEMFDEWYAEHLGNLHYEALSLAVEPLAAFQLMGNFGDEPTYPEFEKAWKRRFGLQLELPANIENGGWYLVYFAKALELAHKMWAGAEQTRFPAEDVELAKSFIDRLHACYGTRGFQGKVNDSAWALVRLEARRNCKYLIVTDACLPYIQGPLYVSKTGIDFHFADGTDRFHFTINSPKTVEFQRASTIFFTHPILDPKKLALQCFPIVMSWIFAGGYQNAIDTAENALSHRHGATYSEARRMLRAALGIGLPPPSERF